MDHRLAHRVGRTSQATPAALDKSPSASHTKNLTLPRARQPPLTFSVFLRTFVTAIASVYWRDCRDATLGTCFGKATNATNVIAIATAINR